MNMARVGSGTVTFGGGRPNQLPKKQLVGGGDGGESESGHFEKWQTSTRDGSSGTFGRRWVPGPGPDRDLGSA